MKSNERDEKKPRKRYEPPRVDESATFETLALACGKTPPEITLPCMNAPSLS